MKYHIEKNTVQETLVIPLYGRKMCSELYPNLYRDETGRSCDNGTCKIYNLDFSGVIAVRDALLPAGDQEENIACDLNDTSWFRRIDASGGAVFFAAGVFYYFLTE